MPSFAVISPGFLEDATQTLTSNSSMVENPETKMVKRAEQTGSRAVESHFTWSRTSHAQCGIYVSN